MLVISLAMPLQGVAAATMFHCDLPPADTPAGATALDHSQLRTAGPLHQHSHPHEQQHGHQHGVPGAHGHDASHHHAAGPAADDGGADEQQQPASKCSACASCCTATALPSTAIVLPSPELARAFDTPGASRIAPFVTHGPERPPRLFLA